MSGTSSSLKRKLSVYDPKFHSSSDSTPTLLRRGAGPERAVVVGGARKHRHHLPIYVTLITFSMVHTTLQNRFQLRLMSCVAHSVSIRYDSALPPKAKASSCKPEPRSTTQTCPVCCCIEQDKDVR
ncbi:hypothetical protein IG631_19593 [Alternaria alternata]|nr:hypothetical protein IG631_19593 [Alternaria alternata]